MHPPMFRRGGTGYAGMTPREPDPPKPVKLTPAQAAMLRNEQAGRPLCAGLHGRSEHGGAARTMASLLRKQLLRREGGLTPLGEVSLSAHDKVPSKK